MNSCNKSSSANPVSSAGQTKSGEIGAEGGTATSSDGNIKLQIPQGALSSSTPVKINISTDSLPNGFSAIYDFSPNGLTFSKPATLTIHYSDSLLAGISPLSAGIGYEDDKGNWYGVGGGSVDTVAHTFTVPISHFSKWGIYQSYFISYENNTTSTAAMLTGNSALFHVYKAGKVIEDDAGPVPLFPWQPVQPDHWLVNGVIGGTASSGSIDPSPNIGEAIFTSPAKMPSNNPVAVAAEIVLPNSSKLYLICSTEILAKYWLLTYEFTTGFQCTSDGWAFHGTYGDTTSIVFQLGKDFQVSSWLPSGSSSGITDVGVCNPQYSVQITSGNPSQITNVNGGYDLSSNMFKLKADMVEADYLGYTLSSEGVILMQVNVETGMPYTSPVVFQGIKSSYIYGSNDKNQGLPQFVGYTWTMNENQ